MKFSLTLIHLLGRKFRCTLYGNPLRNQRLVDLSLNLSLVPIDNLLCDKQTALYIVFRYAQLKRGKYSSFNDFLQLFQTNFCDEWTSRVSRTRGFSENDCTRTDSWFIIYLWMTKHQATIFAIFFSTNFNSQLF